MKPNRSEPLWSRRRLLRDGSLAALPMVSSGWLDANQVTAPTSAPFSRFTDVEHNPALPSQWFTEPQAGYLHVESMGGGCAFIDYDNDGWMDLFLLGGRTLDGTPPGSGNRLYHNNRDGSFTDVTAKAGLADPRLALGCALVTTTMTGLGICLDLLTAQPGSPNNGDGTFTDVTSKAGLLHIGNGSGPDALSWTTTATATWTCLSRTTWTSTWPPHQNQAHKWLPAPTKG